MQIRRLSVDDIGAVFTLQRAAFVDEARLYDTPFVPALDETLDELTARLDQSESLVAVDEGRDPEAGALGNDARRRVERALLTLPRRFREAVVLRDLQELSYQEIAEILGVRIGAVRSRIARGRDRLRVALEAGR